MIIGQKNLLSNINKIIDSYPKFSIICGAKKSGKRMIVKYICEKLNLPIVFFSTGIDDVRNIIDLSYEQVEPICYVCADADNMSLGAKNALLKITEEPPNKAYFILTLESLSNTLSTIQSRATCFSLDNYSVDELLEYRKQKNYNSKYDNILKDICTTTGEVDELFYTDIQAFYQFANTIVEQIHIPVTGNIFKISKAVKSKQDDTGYDAVLLFNTVRNLYLKKALQTKKVQYLYASNVTTKCLQDLKLANVNIIGTIDNWIMDVRAVLRGL